MKILILSNYPATRSPITSITPLVVAALERLGHEVRVECWGRHREQESKTEKLVGRVRDIVRIARVLRATRPDVLFINTATGWLSLGREIAMLAVTRRLARITVLLLHGTEPIVFADRGARFFRAMTRLRANLVDAVMVLSKEELRMYEEHYPTARFYRVDNPFVPRCTPRPRQPLAGRPAELLFVGRLIRAKGLIELVDAVAALGEIPFRLTIAGEGPLRDELIERIGSLGISDRVRLTGYVTGTVLDRLYEGADIFVLPSYSEGFPTVIAEAMGAGLPVVTTYLRGALDHLQEGVNGFFVPARNVLELTAALRQLIQNGWDHERLLEANREKLDEFSPSTVVTNYVHIFRELITSDAGGVGRVPSTPERS